MIVVIHLITGLETGGAEMMLAKLVEQSDRSRFQHRVVSLLEPGPIGERIAAAGIPVQSLRMRPNRPDPHALAALMATLRREKPDLLQTWLYHADFLGTLAGQATRTPVVWNIRTSPHADLGRQIGVITKLCARLSSTPLAVIANSESARSMHLQQGYRPREWQVIPNGFDTERFRPNSVARQALRQELGLPASALLIGAVGRDHPQKDYATYLAAAEDLATREPEVHFLLVGRGLSAHNAALQAAVASHGLERRVHLLGERRDTPAINAALDIATSSSAFGESFPNTIGEAMACAVPVVATDVGDAARIIAQTGIVVPPRQPRALAAAWGDLVAIGETGRKDLGEKARDRVIDVYSLASVVRQYEELYERLVGTL